MWLVRCAYSRCREASPLGLPYSRSDGGFAARSFNYNSLHVSDDSPGVRFPPPIVYVAAIGHPYGPNAERGIYRSLDAGQSWQQVLFKDDNTGGSAFTPTVSFRVVDTSSTVQPPVQIDGGSTIRNKGTSIWVWELIFTFAALLAGFVIGYAANTLNASGSPSPLLFGVAGLVLGFGFGYMYSKGGFKRLG